MNLLIYVIPIAVILIIFIIGFAAARKKAAQYGEAYAAQPEKAAQITAEAATHGDRIYEKPGVNQASSHPLGAVQSVIRGRIRFIPFGIMLIGIALMGGYFIFIAKLDLFEAGDAWYIQLVEAALLLGAIVWGLQLFYFATCSIKLRRCGFEICSILGTKGYEYKDAEFRLFESVEHKNKGDGYRPMVMKTQNFNWLWVCQIYIKSQHKLIEVKSSRYARLWQKMTNLTQSLATEDRD